MKNFSTPKIFDLAGPAGKTASLTPGTTPVVATFNCNNLPTGKNGNLWYYATALIVEVRPTVTMASSAGAAINPDELYQIVQSMRVYSPLLGDLFSHTNTPGAQMGTIQQYFGKGFQTNPTLTTIPSTNSASVVPVLKYRIPFAFDFLTVPQDTAPWMGFLEGGLLEVRIDVSTVLDSISTGTTIGTTTVTAWFEMEPSPEATIHVPNNARRHANLPGSTKRTTITDVGAPDGLAGVDQSKGCGVASLLYLTNATGIGLGGQANQTAANITQVEIPWRDQTVTDNPEAFFEAFFTMMGPHSRTSVASNFAGFPYTDAATTTTGLLANAQALFFPLISCGREFNTSKMQSVSGAKDLNFNYTTTPTAGPVILGHYFYTFDPAFVAGKLVPLIKPGAKGVLRVKTKNKQRNVIAGTGKAAYMRLKVVA